MFLHLSVILLTGGGGLCPEGSLSRGGLCPGGGSLSRGRVSVQGKGFCLGDLCPGGVSVQRGSLSKGVSVQREDLCPGEGLCPGGGSLSRVGSLSGGVSVRDPPPHRTVTCGRYASYWNAFLYLNVSMSKCVDNSRVVLQFQVGDVVLFSLSKNYGNVQMELLFVYEICAK